jgi:hypothetical protein
MHNFRFISVNTICIGNAEINYRKFMKQVREPLKYIFKNQLFALKYTLKYSLIQIN